MYFQYSGHCSCGANHNQGIYGTNMWNVNANHPGNSTCQPQSACGTCLDIIKGECIRYTGSNLPNTGINKNDLLNDILVKLDTIKAIEDTKNANILAALNDINDRLNALESGTDHPPYTLL